MGVFSKVHRYREAGEDVNVNNEERFGLPVRSLFTSTKFFTLQHMIRDREAASSSGSGGSSGSSGQ